MTRPELQQLVDRIPESALSNGAQVVGPEDLWTLSNVVVELANWSAELWTAWIDHNRRGPYQTTES